MLIFSLGTYNHTIQSFATSMAATGLMGPLSTWQGVSATEELDFLVASRFNSFKLKLKSWSNVKNALYEKCEVILLIMINLLPIKK